MHKFRITGENAGAKKCLSELRTPIDSAVREIKRMYGNIIRFKETAKSKVFLSKPAAKSLIM